MAAFEKALELDPTHSAALRDRGLMLLDAGLAGERADLFAFAASLSSADWQGFAIKANSIYRKKSYPDALQTFRVSHELDPEKFEPRLGIFLCL